MNKKINIQLIILCLFLHIATYAQTKDTVISSDTLHHNGIDYVNKTCRYYAGRVDFRDERPVAGKVIYELQEFYNEKHILWLIKQHGEKKFLPNYNMNFNYFLDKELNSDGTYSELLVVNLNTFGGVVCHLIKYDKTGKVLKDSIISSNKYNSLARKCNRKRRKLMTKENSGGRILDVRLIPCTGFGK
ncbi:MAG: hypothetical protein ACXVPU_18095 [Bacteroidia bacterium]